MTLGSAFLVLGIAVVPLIAFITYAGYCHAGIIRLARYEYWSDRFFAAVKRIISCDGTPDDIVESLESMSKMLTSKTASYSLYSHYYEEITASKKKQAVADNDPAFAEFCKANPEIMNLIEEAYHSGLLAMSYTSQVYGEKARAVLADYYGLGSRSHIQRWRGIKVADSAGDRLRSLVPLIGRGF